MQIQDILYYVFWAGLFFVIMRFGCGAHIMGHGHHHDAAVLDQASGTGGNHADGVASMDLFVVPTISFRLLYGFLILHHGRREILWIGTTAHPSAEWIARQLTEAFGWEEAPRYIIRDRIALMAILSSGDFGRWAFGIVPPRRDRHGRTGIVKG